MPRTLLIRNQASHAITGAGAGGMALDLPEHDPGRMVRSLHVPEVALQAKSLTYVGNVMGSGGT